MSRMLDGIGRLIARYLDEPVHGYEPFTPSDPGALRHSLQPGDVLLVEGNSHIAGVINAPAAHKYQHWTNPAVPPTFEEWLAGAVEHPGSWWPHWAAWLKKRSGAQVPARDPAKGPLKPLDDAPGSFVKVRS